MHAIPGCNDKRIDRVCLRLRTIIGQLREFKRLQRMPPQPFKVIQGLIELIVLKVHQEVQTTVEDVAILEDRSPPSIRSLVSVSSAAVELTPRNA